MFIILEIHSQVDEVFKSLFQNIGLFDALSPVEFEEVSETLYGFVAVEFILGEMVIIPNNEEVSDDLVDIVDEFVLQDEFDEALYIVIDALGIRLDHHLREQLDYLLLDEGEGRVGVVDHYHVEHDLHCYQRHLRVIQSVVTLIRPTFLLLILQQLLLYYLDKQSVILIHCTNIQKHERPESLYIPCFQLLIFLFYVYY